MTNDTAKNSIEVDGEDILAVDFNDSNPDDFILMGQHESCPEGYHEVTQSANSNTSFEKTLENVKYAKESGLKILTLSECESMPKDQEVVFVCGGWSAEDNFQEIKALYDSGINVWSCNGSHDWLIERGIIPTGFILFDAQPKQIKYLKNSRSDIKYLLSTKTDPSVLDHMKDMDVQLWHPMNSKNGWKNEINDVFAGSGILWIAGGTSVGVKGMKLLMAMGMSKIHMFGFDCCLDGERHHVYEFDNGGHEHGVIEVKLPNDDRVWYTTRQLAASYLSFMNSLEDLIASRIDFDIKVYGDGMLAYNLNKNGDKNEL